MALNCATPDDVLKAIKDKSVQMIDLRFADLPGVWQHFSVPPSAVDADALSEGIGFDGSSIRGFQEIQESDMLVVPDPTTAFLDPFTTATTLVLICNVRDPVTGQTYSRDARYIAQKAETYLKSTGIGETAYFGPEAEFFVFNEVRYGQGMNYAMHEIDSKEGTWNTGTKEGPNLGHKPRQKEGYFPVPPVDSMQGFCAPKWCSPWSRSESRSKPTTMRSRPPARPRSTCVSRRSRAWPTAAPTYSTAPGRTSG